MTLRKSLLAVIAVIAVIAGCGGGTQHSTTTVTTTRLPAPAQLVPPAPAQTLACPPGRSFMGCATPLTAGFSGRNAAVISALSTTHALVPDVSSFQGHPGWAQVKSWQVAHGWTPTGIFKLGEFVTDPDAGFNAATLHDLGMIAIGYWFVRNTGCAHESAEIITNAKTFSVHLVVLDMEVPEAAGYAPCLAGPLERAGFKVVIYSAPGTWPGGSSDGLPGWIATYGPSHGCLPFTCTILAWQFTDGSHGSPVNVPGIGFGDVSMDFGLIALAKPPPPPPPKPVPFAIYPLAKITLFGQQVSERLTVEDWWNNHCENPVRRPVCRSTRTHLQWLAGRLLTLAEAQHEGPDWSSARARALKWPERHYRIERILNG